MQFLKKYWALIVALLLTMAGFFKLRAAQVDFSGQGIGRTIGIFLVPTVFYIIYFLQRKKG